MERQNPPDGKIFCLFINSRFSLLVGGRWSVFTLKCWKILWISFSTTDSALCIYHLVVWSNVIFLHSSLSHPILPTIICIFCYFAVFESIWILFYLIYLLNIFILLFLFPYFTPKLHCFLCIQLLVCPYAFSTCLLIKFSFVILKEFVLFVLLAFVPVSLESPFFRQYLLIYFFQ